MCGSVCVGVEVRVCVGGSVCVCVEVRVTVHTIEELT